MDADPGLGPTAGGSGSNVGSRWEETEVVLRLPTTGQTDKAVRERAAAAPIVLPPLSPCLVISISPSP